MKRCLLFMFCCFFTVSVFAGAVTRYTSGGSVAATGDDLYTVMRTGTAAATGDVVVLTGDVTRGTAETVYGENTTLRSADGSVYTLSMGSGETGRFFNASGKTLVVSNVTLEGAGTTDATVLAGGAISGHLKIENGVNTFQNIETPIATSGNNGGVVNGKITISGGTNLFSSNQSRLGSISHGGAITLSGGTNIFRDNTAAYGGLFYANSTTTGLNISGGTNFFQNNTATSQGGALEGYLTITGGTTYFTGNNALSSAGAILAYGVEFSGDDTVVVFEGNRGGGLMNDIQNHTGATRTMTVSGNGTYSFGGGVKINNFTTTGGNITFGEGSISNIFTSLSLTNTNLTIRYGNVTTPVTSSTSFAAATLTDGGGNDIQLIVNPDFAGTRLIAGNVSGLTVVPQVSMAKDSAGYARITAANSTGLDITKNTTFNGVAHLGTSGLTQTLKEERSTLYSATKTATNGDVLLLAGDVTRGAGELVFSSGTLTIRSASETPRSISMGGGETGRFINAGGTTVVLDGVNLSGGNALSVGGGAVYTNTVRIEGSTTLANNQTSASGGAIRGNLIVDDGENHFSGNVAQLGGVVRGKVTINGGENTFSDNVAEYGGAWYGALEITGGTNIFDGNRAISGTGGAAEGETFTISGGTSYFTNNVAKGVGGALYCQGEVKLSGNDTVGIFKNNFTNGGSVRNDIYARNDGSASKITISGGTYFFDGGLRAVALDVSGGDTTLANGSISNGWVSKGTSEYIALALSGGSLSLQGSATLQANVTQNGGSLNFEATPQAKGFGKLITQSAPTGTMNVGVDGFTTMKDATSYTLVQGAAVNATAFSFNDALFNVATNGTNTTLSLNTTGTLGNVFGQATFNDLIGLNNGDSRSISDYNLTVTTDNPELFATWLEESTGLKSVAMAGYVTVKLDELAEILGNDHFVWDFSDYVAGATLTGVNVNQWSFFAPEPSSWILLLLGIGLLRRKRNVSMGTQR